MQTTPCRANDLRCERLVNPLGLDETRPRLSWQMLDDRIGACQQAYQIAAATSRERLETQPDLWDSGRVEGDASVDVVYAGKRLRSRQAVWWRVRVWDLDGVISDWSHAACFEMGLLKPSDWSAQWIGRAPDSGEGSQPSPFLRREFALREAIVSARCYVTARGLFELHLNGRRVGSDLFTPGWTDYARRIPCLVYDVTDWVQAGPNAVGAVLGEGWYAGYMGWGTKRNLYGDRLSLLLQLEVTYADGTRETVVSGPEWVCCTGPILASDIYHGEWYDARREISGWSSVGLDAGAWAPVSVEPPPSRKTLLVGRRSPPVRRQEILDVQAQSEPVFGVHIFDLGQNMVGWARIKVRAPAGRVVTIRYGEMLNADGTLYTANLRSARCTDRYVCKGGDEEIYEPHFTFHGFRYVELTNLVEKPQASDVVGVVLHSDLPATGMFECSDPLVNRLQQNIVWGQKGNFFEVPTDCPQRDERLGWTGDAQVFIRTAAFNRDVSAFFAAWCESLADDQHPNGSVPHVIPDIVRHNGVGCAGWSDAAVICPWTIYLCYGDTRILERQYESMTRWMGWQEKNSRNGLHGHACYGDWLAIDLAENNPGRTPTPRDLIGTAYFAHTAAILARVARILKRGADARKYAALAARVRRAFNSEFVSPNGRLAGDTQTGYLMALGFDLLPAAKRPKALEYLVRDIEARGWHLSTGFLGTPLLAPVLSRFGRSDVAYKLLLQQTYPSWLYTVLQGATTMWERWNSYTKERGFGDVGMNSFNHYAYGAIGEWMYATVAGLDLDPEEPGYRHLILRPTPGGGLTWARAELITPYGKAACGWTLEKEILTVRATVPPNTHATVFLPGQKPRKIGAGRWEFQGAGRTQGQCVVD